MPEAFRFRLRLNSSYDGNPRIGDEVVYPDDSTYEKAHAVMDCTAEQAVAELWREGRVPEWIDVSVIGETGSTTLIQLQCCGRFTADDQRLYHQQGGRPPFQIEGPSFPPRYDGQPFSIHLRSECWSRGEIERLRDHAAKVWSLDLVGHALDDASLLELPELPQMELLVLRASALTGRGLTDLARHKKLRVLRIRLDRPDDFTIPELPSLHGLEIVDIVNLPGRPWGSEHLARSIPGAVELGLHTSGELHVDGECPPRLTRLSLSAQRIVGSFRPPARLESLALGVSQMGESEIRTWLKRVTSIASLHLKGTPLSDSYAETLPAKYGLTYLDVVNTGVSTAAVSRIAATHPTLKMHPKPAAPIP